jgi:WhiB family transcriptional regulator, redox-sensing transcriptional regulator
VSRGWMDRASCTQVAPDLFFADGTNLVDTKLAKAVCKGCPVIDQCLEYALVNRMDHGVWGGLNDRERKALLRRMKVPRKIKIK